MAVLRGCGRLCTSWVWLAPLNSLTRLPLLDSLVQKTAQTFVIDIGSERGVQARTLQDQLYACIRIVNRFFHK